MTATIEIIDFYNQGAQVQLQHPGVDMTHSFSADGDGATEEIGYIPKSNSGKPAGWSHDVIEHNGGLLLALKGGYVYSVTITVPETEPATHTISAENGHVLLPLPANAEVDVDEYDPSSEPSTPIWREPTTIEDLLSMPAEEPDQNITVTEVFSEAYGVPVGEIVFEELIEKLINEGHLVRDADGNLSPGMLGDDGGDAPEEE